MRRVFNISLGLLIVYLSYPVVQNLLSSRQRMNTSFEPLRIVNTYGAFGRYATFTCTVGHVLIVSRTVRRRTQLNSAAVVIDWRIHYASVSCMLQCLIGFSITKERTEVVFKGTYAQNPNDPKAEWLEYEFKCKPGAYG